MIINVITLISVIIIVTIISSSIIIVILILSKCTIATMEALLSLV